MAGVENRVAMTTAMTQWIDSIGTALRAEAVEAAFEIAEVGLDTARKTIDTTPSDLSSYPKNNRNWTYHMRSSLSNSVDQSNLNKVTVSVGWLNTKEGYFLIQEDGGEVKGHTITAMNALGHAQHEMLQTLKTRGIQ